MKSYEEKQSRAKLYEDDIVIPNLRNNLVEQLYKNVYPEYYPHMDEIANRNWTVMDVRDNGVARPGIIISTNVGTYIYPYFLLDLVETYDEEEDI